MSIDNQNPDDLHFPPWREIGAMWAVLAAMIGVVVWLVAC